MKVVIGICFVFIVYNGVNAHHCGTPTIENGSTSFEETTYGSLANITCDQGFTLTDEDDYTIYCQYNGQWSSAPVCVQGCNSPAITGPLSYASRSYNSNITILCEDGFSLNGNSYITCLTNGSWTEIPKCSPIDCGFPKLANGMIDSFSPSYFDGMIEPTSYLSVIEVICDTGYKIPCFSDLFLCTADGNWTSLDGLEFIGCSSDADCPAGEGFSCNNAGECECPYSYYLHVSSCIYDCGDPPLFEVDGINLTYTFLYGNRLEGDYVYYFCPDGYAISGTDIGVCEVGGWTNIQPVCVRDCGNVPAILNGNLAPDDPTNTTVGNTATVNCNAGYTESNTTILCLDTGQWDIPSCILIDCGNVPAILNGNLAPDDPTNTTVGNTATVNCDAGYTESNSTIQCLVTGQWEIASCSLIDCGNVPAISNGNLTLDDPTNTTVGNTATVNCDSGYTESNNRILCLDTGQWEIASCASIECSELVVANGKLNDSVTTYGTVISVECDQGYILNGNTEIECQVGGKWSDIPSCDPVDCGVLSVTNGNVSNSSTTYGTVVDVYCLEGYTISNATRVECHADGTWSGSPTCDPVDCGSNFNISNSWVTLINGTDTTFGASADVECHYGYETNTTTILCQLSGEWETSVCTRIDCGPVPNILYSNITLDVEGETKFNDRATVVCETGYSTEINNNLYKVVYIFCRGSGTWDNRTCDISDCGSPPNDTLNGQFVLGDERLTTYEANATLTCEEGYESSTPVITCQEYDTWSKYEPCLIKDCGDLSVKNGNISSSTTTYGTKIFVNCFDGYKVSNPLEIECQANGNWSDIPTCDQVDCGELSVVNGNLNDTATTFGTVVGINCIDGYVNNSDTPAVCQSDSFWSGNLSCEPVDCGNVPSIENGNVDLLVVGNSSYGAIGEVTCKTGYNTTIDSIQCLETGKWDNVTCNIVDCGSEFSITNGKVTLRNGTDTTFGALADVECDPGFETNTSSISCQWSGKWETSICKQIDCGPVPEILNANITLAWEGETQINARAVVECEMGYRINGTSLQFDFIFCRQSGTWDNRTCHKVDCGSPPNETFTGKFMLDDEGVTTYEAKATLTCVEGYESNSPAITCQESGNWSTYEPCVVKDCDAVPVIERGTIIPADNGNTTYGAEANVTCDTGFNSSKDYIRCLSNGTWESVSCEMIVCGEIPLINNGITDLQEAGNSSYGALADVTCETGYNTTVDSIRCRETGEWDNTTCNVIDCGDVPLIDNGNVTLQMVGNSSYGALADVTCNTGYNTTADNIRCQETGEWDNAQCSIVDCGNVPTIMNGNIALMGITTYGELANVTCNVGYNGTTDVIQCRSSGQWETTTCTLVDCGYIPSISNGNIVLVEAGNTTYGALANVTCDTGYNATTNLIECYSSGQWGETSCVLIDCGEVPVITKGNAALLEDNNTTYGALANVSCDTGYNASVGIIRCLETGLWLTSECQILDCDAVPDVLNGIVTLLESENTTYGKLAEVKCDRGYNATFSTIRCLETGEWETPNCAILDCQDIPVISDGQITLVQDGNTTYGAVANVTCSTGYIATVNTITCMETGKWDNSTCHLIDCGKVPVISDGQISLVQDGNTTFGALADVSCSIGYNATVDTILCLGSGKWDNASCKVLDCRAVPVILNGQLTLAQEGNTTYGATADVLCFTGYNATLNTIQCLDTGNWDNVTCSLIDCEDAPVISNGKITLVQDGNTTYGALADVSCSIGYNATVDTVRCLDTGKWDNATCSLIDCGDVPNVTKGTVSLLMDSNTTYGALANVSCTEGYNASVGMIQCLLTGHWQTTECQLLECDTVPNVLNGVVTLLEAENTTYGTLAEVSCEVGYNSSTETIKCLATGKWDTPQCELLDCGDVPIISNGKMILVQDGNTTFGAIANVLCSKGYNATVDTILCLDTGEWNNASCSLIDCGELEDIENGNVNTSNGTTYNSIATYSCNEGLIIIGDETRVCQQNGKWSKTTPDCLSEGAIKCLANTDQRGAFWNEIAAGRNRSQECKTNFTGTVNRQCGTNGVWKYPEYLCIRESVKNVISQIDMLNGNASQQIVLDALQNLKDVTVQSENIAEQDKLTDLEVSSLVSSTEAVANLLLSTPYLISSQITDDFTWTISNLIDVKNTGSWNAIIQTSSKVAEKMLTSMETLGKAMAKRVASGEISLPPVASPNIALQVQTVTSINYVFPGSDTFTESNSDNWLRQTKSKINFNPASLGGTSQQPVVSAAIFRDISNIMPDKSETEQLNGQILSFSTLPPLNGTVDPPITMSFEQTNDQLTKATCSFWKFDDSGSDGYWSSDGCSVKSSIERLTECECNHTTNFAVILSLQDCGQLGSPDNGELINSGGTKYKAEASFRCNPGYSINGANTSVCLFNGTWSHLSPSCLIKNCSNLRNPENGFVLTPDGTTLNNEAVYSCEGGYTIKGSERRVCLQTGVWSSSEPTCVEAEGTPDICEKDEDSRGLTWQETIVGNSNEKSCQEGFTGLVSRACGPGGVWKLPQYDCVRDSIVKVEKKVSTLNENSTSDEVDTVLEEVLKVTAINETTESNKMLTSGELSVISSSLKTVADVLATSSGIINENITDEFLEIASNLVDDSNQESWQSLSQSEDNDESETILKAVDSLAEVLSNSVEEDPENNGTLIVKKNIAIDVKRVSNEDVVFPDTSKIDDEKDDENVDWFKDSMSSLLLEASALKNTTVKYATTAVIFRDLSKILPGKRKNDTNKNSDGNEDVINAPVLSLTISPPVSDKLQPPLRLTFSHRMNNLSNPVCSYWAFPSGNKGQGFWSSDGCVVNTTNTNYTICQCDHLTNFAVLMSPFVEADASSKALRIISMVGIGISIACLAATLIVHIYFWRYLRNDRTTVLMNLCVALLFSYILFLSGVDRTESSVACTVIAAVLQYIYLVVFCIMLVEGIEIAITVLYVFKTKSRIKLMLLIAWVIPAIIVGISLGATQTDGYGNENFCWLSVDNGLIWSFVGPALLIITFNGVCLIVVIRIMFKTKAMETKTAMQKIKTSFRSLCVLVPVMGVSWVLGIFYINDSFYFIQYIFAILNGLQGFFIFLFHCILNEHVKKAIQNKNRRRSSAKETLKTTLRSTSRDERKSKDIRETGKSLIDSGDFTKDDSEGWKDKILKTQQPQLDVKFSTPLGFYGNGRRAATFAAESRDKLTSRISRSVSNASINSSARLEANLFSSRL